MKLNVEFYPNAWNVYDSLAEAYMTNGEKDLAIANYKKSLELNPQNANGRDVEKTRPMSFQSISLDHERLDVTPKHIQLDLHPGWA